MSKINKRAMDKEVGLKGIITLFLIIIIIALFSFTSNAVDAGNAEPQGGSILDKLVEIINQLKDIFLTVENAPNEFLSTTAKKSTAISVSKNGDIIILASKDNTGIKKTDAKMKISIKGLPSTEPFQRDWLCIILEPLPDGAVCHHYEDNNLYHIEGKVYGDENKELWNTLIKKVRIRDVAGAPASPAGVIQSPANVINIGINGGRGIAKQGGVLEGMR